MTAFIFLLVICGFLIALSAGIIIGFYTSGLFRDRRDDKKFWIAQDHGFGPDATVMLERSDSLKAPEPPKKPTHSAVMKYKSPKFYRTIKDKKIIAQAEEQAKRAKPKKGVFAE